MLCWRWPGSGCVKWLVAGCRETVIDRENNISDWFRISRLTLSNPHLTSVLALPTNTIWAVSAVISVTDYVTGAPARPRGSSCVSSCFFFFSSSSTSLCWSLTSEPETEEDVQNLIFWCRSICRSGRVGSGIHIWYAFSVTINYNTSNLNIKSKH